MWSASPEWLDVCVEEGSVVAHAAGLVVAVAVAAADPCSRLESLNLHARGLAYRRCCFFCPSASELCCPASHQRHHPHRCRRYLDHCHHPHDRRHRHHRHHHHPHHPHPGCDQDRRARSERNSFASAGSSPPSPPCSCWLLLQPQSLLLTLPWPPGSSK